MLRQYFTVIINETTKTPHRTGKIHKHVSLFAIVLFSFLKKKDKKKGEKGINLIYLPKFK